MKCEKTKLALHHLGFTMQPPKLHWPTLKHKHFHLCRIAFHSPLTHSISFIRNLTLHFSNSNTPQHHSISLHSLPWYHRREETRERAVRVANLELSERGWEQEITVRASLLPPSPLRAAISFFTLNQPWSIQSQPPQLQPLNSDQPSSRAWAKPRGEEKKISAFWSREWAPFEVISELKLADSRQMRSAIDLHVMLVRPDVELQHRKIWCEEKRVGREI